MNDCPEISSVKSLDYSAWSHKTRRSYDRMSGFYDLMSNHYEKKSRERGLEILQLAPGERVMVIGCGTGHSLVYLAGCAADKGGVFGLELSRGMLRQSLKHLREKGLDGRAALIQGDAHDLPVRDASLDGLFMAFTLELFPPGVVEHVLRECRRVLAPVAGWSWFRSPRPRVRAAGSAFMRGCTGLSLILSIASRFWCAHWLSRPDSELGSRNLARSGGYRSRLYSA
jgi:ubiquinone/menaquinone biosynthesis C-methylase UbiE